MQVFKHKNMQLYNYSSMQVNLFKNASTKNKLQNLFTFHPIF